MTDLLSSFIEKAPFAAVLWELQEDSGKKDFYMKSFNSLADEYDRRNFSLFLGQPFKSSFPEAPDLRDAFFEAIETQQRIDFAVFEHQTLRTESNYFQIWVIPLDKRHIIIMYQNITEKYKG